MRKINKGRTVQLVACASILTLSLLSAAAPRVTSAQAGGASASGSFEFSLEDGYTKYVDFDAKAQADGTATGQMTFSGEEGFPDQDVDGTGDPDLKYPPSSVYVKAEFDCLTVNKNQAVMSGVVKDSSPASYTGQRVLLVVEDNGDDASTPDRLTWGFYKTAKKDWTPTDAEREDDKGAELEWIATDAERKDDVGVPSKKSEVVTCQSFPVSSYNFVEFQRGAGNVKVQP